jgi:hypothetical protein
MGLISLVYVSFESRPMSQADILDILETARKRNNAENITGMLLYRTGYFIQALEGEEAPVTQLYEDIAKDDRHRNVMMIYKNPIEKRSFGNWSMGFKNLEGIDPHSLEGYTDFLTQTITPELIGDGSRAKAFLELFKEEANY